MDIEFKLAELMLGKFQNWKTRTLQASEKMCRQMLQNLQDDLQYDLQNDNKILSIIANTLNEVITLEHYNMFLEFYKDFCKKNLSQEQMVSLYNFCSQNTWYLPFNESIEIAFTTSDMLIRFNQFIATKINESLSNSGI